MVDTTAETSLGSFQIQEWSQRTRSEIYLDEKAGIIRKKINYLEGFNYGLTHVPEAEDYKERVGWAIEVLEDEAFGLKEFLPKSELIIEEDLKGESCYIDSKYIKGERLEDIVDPNEAVVSQLVEFLTRCIKMAEITKKSDMIILPDLLGGVEKPNPEFRNFIVEEETDKLFFVDFYPLAILGTGISAWGKRRKYRQNLENAAKKMGDDRVFHRAHALNEILK
ncbi:MAG: hypothetical protein WCV81_00310 [Microgenomates group bacterium]|jgi:hypothetical protein